MTEEKPDLSITKSAVTQLVELLSVDLKKLKQAVDEYLRITSSGDYNFLVAPELQGFLAKHLGRRHAVALVSMVMGLIKLRESLTVPPTVVVSSFREVVAREESVKPFSEKLESFFAIVEKFVSDEKAYEIFKASELLFDLNDETVLSCRILTEVRPVFSRRADDIRGAIVRNILRIEVDMGEANHVSSYNLPDDQIDSLMEQLQRAKTKTNTLTEKMKEITPRIALRGAISNEY